jgi:hypothetical protein
VRVLARRLLRQCRWSIKAAYRKRDGALESWHRAAGGEAWRLERRRTVCHRLTQITTLAGDKNVPCPFPTWAEGHLSLLSALSTAWVLSSAQKAESPARRRRGVVTHAQVEFTADTTGHRVAPLYHRPATPVPRQMSCPPGSVRGIRTRGT